MFLALAPVGGSPDLSGYTAASFQLGGFKADDAGGVDALVARGTNGV